MSEHKSMEILRANLNKMIDSLEKFPEKDSTVANATRSGNDKKSKAQTPKVAAATRESESDSLKTVLTTLVDPIVLAISNLTASHNDLRRSRT